MDFFFCRNEDCSRQTCAHCKTECHQSTGIYTDADYDQALADSANFLYHMECADLAPFKIQFEQAISLGTGMACPSCGHFGRKDDACTHIRCIKCQTMYCYVCGILESACDKEGDTGTIYNHNIDWDINPRRCPMYLTEVAQIDNRWSEDDDECVAFISRMKTIYHLREAYHSMGATRFEQLMAKYASLRNSGFTANQIFREDLTLIKRSQI
jgi:hypothetical protein